MNATILFAMMLLGQPLETPPLPLDALPQPPIEMHTPSQPVITPGVKQPDHLRALFTLTVPANATITVDGEPTTQMGTVREFQSPPLDDGRHQYRFRVLWTDQSGVRRFGEKTVYFNAGDKVVMTFGEEVSHKPAIPFLDPRSIPRKTTPTVQPDDRP